MNALEQCGGKRYPARRRFGFARSKEFPLPFLYAMEYNGARV